MELETQTSSRLKDHVSNNSISLYQTCKRRWKHKYLDNKPQDYSIHLDFGSALAKSVDAMRKGEVDVMGAVRVFQEHFEGKEENDKKNLQTATYLINNFNESEPFEVLKSELMVSIDLPVIHPDTGKNINYIGYVDALVKNEDGMFPLDDKTMSRDELDNEKWKKNQQLIGYIHCLKENGYDCINQFCVKGMICSGSKSIKHVVHKVTDRDIENWHSNIVSITEDMVRSYKEMKYQQNFNACFNFYHKCEFYNLCFPEE